MRRAGVGTFLVVAVLGLAGLLLVGLTDDRDLAFTLGVRPSATSTAVAPGATVCQEPILVPESFTRVRLRAGTPLRPGQPLEVTVRNAANRQVVGRGQVAGGYVDGSDLIATVGPVEPGQGIAVCVRDAGDRRALLYGNAAGASLRSQAKERGRVLDTDLTVVFLRPERQTVLSELPDIFDRASLFRPGWVGSWTFWLLSALTLIAVPLMLARALADSSDAP
jgi:hypothetical protein